MKKKGGEVGEEEGEEVDQEVEQEVVEEEVEDDKEDDNDTSLVTTEQLIIGYVNLIFLKIYLTAYV